MSTSQVFEILVDYLVDEGTIVAWGSSSIHLGSLCSGTPTVSRDFELTIQPYDEKHKEWKPLVKSDTSAVRAEIFTHKRVNTSSGQDASVFTVRVFADPSQLPPKGSAVLRVDDLDVAPISVTWIAVPELQRAPVNKLLFLEQSPTAQVRTLVFWNNLHSKMEIVSTRHSGRNLSIEVDSQPHPQYVQRLRVEARPEFGASDAGIIEVLIRTAGRQDRTELVPVSTILAN